MVGKASRLSLNLCRLNRPSLRKLFLRRCGGPCGFDHRRVAGGVGRRVIFISGNDFTVSLYSLLEFLTDVTGRLLRHAASFEEKDQGY